MPMCFNLFGPLAADQALARQVVAAWFPDIWIEDDGVDRMFRPQAFWLADANRNELLVDHVLKVETLDEDLRNILSGLGVKESLLPEVVPRLNTTEGSSEQFDLSPETAEREIIIAHGDDAYRLRLTSQNKLILTK